MKLGRLDYAIGLLNKAKAYNLAPDWERKQMSTMDVVREHGTAD